MSSVPLKGLGMGTCVRQAGSAGLQAGESRLRSLITGGSRGHAGALLCTLYASPPLSTLNAGNQLEGAVL